VQGITLVRHGKADAPAGDRFRGREDFALSSEGRAQAGRVAQALDGHGIDLVVSSPLLRARQTAETIARALGVSLEIDPDLTDIDCGAWTGLTLDEVKDRWPAQWDVWLRSPRDASIPGGEGLVDLSARALRAVARIAQEVGENVCFVSHRAVLKLICLDALGTGPGGFWRIRLDTASVSEIRLWPVPVLVRLNSVVL
jgi:broad specificity phosphatase PhoE